MAAYVILDITISDPKEYEEYKRHAAPAVEAYDGKYLVRGGISEALEGVWNPQRMVILEFPTVERAKEWWGSELYLKAKAIRKLAAKTNMIVVQGV